jgi:predicted AAA+ superfamily ATPase
MATAFIRHHASLIRRRLSEPRKFIHVIAGPRQTGKTTLVLQIVERTAMEAHYASADEPSLKNSSWIEQQWESGRQLCGGNARTSCVLVLDEIQKIPQWSETVKRLWDFDTRKKIPLHVMILGSSPLLLQKGLTESLAGRFETIPVTHWSYSEMHSAFGWTLDQYIYYGGYPGAAPLIAEPERWKRYINDSLIETSVARDILLMTRVDKPALLRQLFHLSCSYSGQIVSYQKLTGQLQDAGNTTTLAHYLSLLSHAGMVSGLEKYSAQKIRQRASSPKLLALNTALLSAQLNAPFADAKQHGDVWGRLVETAVGAHLVNSTLGSNVKVMYWREGIREVDYILQQGKKIIAVEVKSGRNRESIAGIQQFSARFRPYKSLLISAEGIPVEKFLTMPVEQLFV